MKYILIAFLFSFMSINCTSPEISALLLVNHVGYSASGFKKVILQTDQGVSKVAFNVMNKSGESWRDDISLWWEPPKELKGFQIRFYSLLFELNDHLAPKVQEKLGNTCKADLEIRDFLVEGLTEIKDVLRSTTDRIKKVVQTLNRDDRIR